MTIALIDFAKEIRDATVTTLQADTRCKVGGTLGVRTIEVLKPQPDGNFRDYGRNAIPAIAVWTDQDSSRWIAGETREFTYDLTIGIVAESGSTTDAMDDLLQLRENVFFSVTDAITNGSNTWLASTKQVLTDGTYETQDFEQVERWPHRFRCMSTIPVRVLYRVSD